MARPVRLVCVLLAALLSCPAASAEPRFPAVSGSVERQGPTITAGPAGATLAVHGSVTVALEPGTRLRVVSDRSLLNLGGPVATPTAVFELQSGTVDVLAGSKDQTPGGAVLVRAPFKISALAARGRLRVSAASGWTAVAGMSGDVRMAVGRRWKVLGAGAAYIMRPGMPEPERTVLPASPALATGRRVWAPTDPAELSGISWKNVPGATSYRVDLVSEDDSGIVSAVVTSGVSMPPLAHRGPGRYRVRVAAVDALGLTGDSAESDVLTVLGVALPEGATIDRYGFVRAFPHQPIGLLHAEGLLAIDPSTHRWAPAPATLYANPDKASLVQIKHPADSEVVPLRLKARKMDVTVDISPRNASWPGAPLRVRVSARGEAGEALAGAPELRPVVTLGVDPLDVDWKDEGSTLSAEIPSPSSGGPWVVRVRVLDPLGNVLARDVVEVARRAPPKPKAPPRLPTVARAP